MTVKVITGNIFTSNAQTIVNTVNCVGIMGAGIALECRLRYPEMYEKYVVMCDKGLLKIGLLWLYKGGDRWVLNFPTKKHWKFPSKKEYLEKGLEKFLSTYKQRGISSIAFPVLGASHGGIDSEESLAIMLSYLEQATIEIEVYRHDPLAKDDRFDETREWLDLNDPKVLIESTGINSHYLTILIEAMGSGSYTQLNQLAKVKGIGVKTLEKVFRASRYSTPPQQPPQPPLF